MKAVRNKYIPFPGFKAVNLFGVLFVRENAVMDETDINHESIHTAQMKELLYIPFYIWYGIEWLVRLIRNGFDAHKAYQGISFEKEAYKHESDLDYLKDREMFNFLKYL